MKERLDLSTTEVPYTLRLDSLKVVSANVGAVVLKALEHLCHGLPYGPAVFFSIGESLLLPVVRINPNVIISASRASCSTPDSGNGVVDPLQGPVGEF